MAKQKKHRMECRWCKKIMVESQVCCDEHRETLAKQSFNLCTICDKYFDTKEEMVSHSHRKAA